MILASSTFDDTVFAWAYVLALPSLYLSCPLYVLSVVAAIYAIVRRYIGVPALLAGVLLPILTLAMVGCRNGPGWLFLLVVVVLPVISAGLLLYYLTAGRRSRLRVNL